MQCVYNSTYQRIERMFKVIHVKCLAPSKGSNTCLLKNKMRACFQGCQRLLDHQTESIPHNAAPRYYTGTASPCVCQGRWPFPSPRQRTLDIREINPGKLTESWLSPALVLPSSCFPQNSCLWGENSFLNPQSGSLWREGDIGSRKSNSSGLRVDGFKSHRGSTAFRFICL